MALLDSSSHYTCPYTHNTAHCTCTMLMKYAKLTSPVPWTHIKSLFSLIMLVRKR